MATEACMKKLILETTAPFQGLPELVACDEGLFAKEGLEIEWVDRDIGVEKITDVNVVSPKGLDPFSSHGRLFEQGQADMYNACEWGNYCRVQDTRVVSRQVGRRGIVTYAAIAVRPESSIYTAQQLAGRSVGVPFYFGTHYLALHMLEGFLPRDLIKICRAPNGARHRLDAMLKGEVEATTLTEPYVTLAEKKGCRLICEAFYHGTEVASDKVDAETYAAFNRAVREAVRRINASNARTCGISSTTTSPRIRRSQPCAPTISARAASWSATPPPSPWTRCSGPTIGSRAGACSNIPAHRSNSSTLTYRATRISRLSEPGQSPRVRQTPLAPSPIGRGLG
jgi:NitT/TauT family transport system substrate-binding protein